MIHSIENYRDAYIEIDLERLKNNFKEIKKVVGDSTAICAVIKANAYGAGLGEITKTLDKVGCDAFGVATLSEAFEVREFSEKPILLLGSIPYEGIKSAIEHNISITLYDKEILQKINEASLNLGKKVNVNFKINSGMNRLGFLPNEETLKIYEELTKNPNINIQTIFTHFATADEKDLSGARMQLNRFNAFLDMLKKKNLPIGKIHIEASPMICSMPEAHYDMIRPGILLYGYFPSDEVPTQGMNLQNIFKIKAKIVHINYLNEGEKVSYGWHYITKNNAKIAVLPLGYADGLPRKLSGNFYVVHEKTGSLCPVAGNICMDQFMIDVSSVENVDIGDECILLGDGSNLEDKALNANEIAERCNTVNYEILTSFSLRLPVKYIE